MRKTLDVLGNASIRELGNIAYIEPIDVLVPVLPRNREICDVWLLRVIFGVAVGLSSASHRRRLRDVLRVHGELAGDGLVRRHDGEAV